MPEFFDNGLAARMLMVMPPLKVKQWTERDVSESGQESVEALSTKRYDLRLDQSPTAESEPLLVDLTPAAKDRWVSFSNAHNLEMKDTIGHERAALAKLEAYCARFALLSHVIRRCAGDTESVYVDLKDIESGIELAGWFGGETRRAYQVLNESPEARHNRCWSKWCGREARRRRSGNYSVSGRLYLRALRRDSRRRLRSEQPSGAQVISYRIGRPRSDRPTLSVERRQLRRMPKGN